MNRREMILAGGATAIVGIPETEAEQISQGSIGMSINQGWATFNNSSPDDAQLRLHWKDGLKPHEVDVPSGGYVAVKAEVLDRIIAAEWRVIR